MGDNTTTEVVKLKRGMWFSRIFYVADVSGGVATVLVQNQYKTREQIEQEGKEIHDARRRSAAANKRRKR